MSHNPEPAKAAAPRTTETTTPARRTVLSLGAGTVAGLGAVVTLSACGSSDPAAAASSAAAGAASAAAGGASQAASAAAGAVVTLADIPVGGSVVKEIAGQKVVLAQPEAGRVVAFKATCPHQGCAVAPAGTKLKCPCHGSTFDGATGAVEQGPATTGLTSLPASISGDGVSLG